MSIEAGTKYQISQAIKEYFNSAVALTVIRNNGITIQFSLEEGKGRGSMPVQHMNYLLKRAELTQIPDKKSLLNTETTEGQTG